MGRWVILPFGAERVESRESGSRTQVKPKRAHPGRGCSSCRTTGLDAPWAPRITSPTNSAIGDQVRRVRRLHAHGRDRRGRGVSAGRPAPRSTMLPQLARSPSEGIARNRCPVDGRERHVVGGEVEISRCAMVRPLGQAVATQAEGVKEHADVGEHGAESRCSGGRRGREVADDPPLDEAGGHRDRSEDGDRGDQ